MAEGLADVADTAPATDVRGKRGKNTMSMRTPVDLFKRYRSEYVATKTPRLVQVEPAHFLTLVSEESLDGFSDENAEVTSLYAVASVLRSIVVAVHHRDFILGKLERISQCDGLTPNALRWKIMIRIPDFVTPDDLARAAESMLSIAGSSANSTWIRYSQIQVHSENLCVQALHVGPDDADAESNTWAFLRGFALTQGLQQAGPLHAIYLSSSRRVPPEHLRTLLRFPVRAVSVTEANDGSEENLLIEEVVI